MAHSAPAMAEPEAEFGFAGSGYALPEYPFVTPPELAGAPARRYPVVIVGAGLAGLSAACEFALQGIAAVLIDEDSTVGVRGAASRGICYAQKSLEIFERLGLYERIRRKGVQWSVGRTMAGADEVYSFDLATQNAHNASVQPPFINIQQFYIEWFLVERIGALANAQCAVELRWQSRALSCSQDADGVQLRVGTPQGEYTLRGDYLIDASGLHSAIRDGFGLPTRVAKGVDRWCIADVRFKQAPPAERWTWIEAPFNDNRAVWQHLMADRVWRLDFQMEAGADMERIAQAEVVAQRLQRQFGPDVQYELVWVGPYGYRTLLMDDFRCGRVFFAGDVAHAMSPFGARGGNSAIQDGNNLAWKLALVLQGRAGAGLLQSYGVERRQGAQENIRCTSRTTRYLAPPSALEKIFRDATLTLARRYPFARAFVNTGRMSCPSVYTASPTLAPEGGRSVQNVRLRWLDGSAADLMALSAWASSALLIFLFGRPGAAIEPGAARLADLSARYPVRFVCVVAHSGQAWARETVVDAAGALARQVGAARGAFAIIRPDAYLAARGAATPQEIEAAIRVVLGWEAA